MSFDLNTPISSIKDRIRESYWSEKELLVCDNDTLRNVIKRMDREEKLIFPYFGIVRCTGKRLPRKITETHIVSYFDSKEYFRDNPITEEIRVREYIDRRVRDVTIGRNPTIVRSSSSFIDVLRPIIYRDVRRIYVVNDEGGLEFIITRKSILNFMFEQGIIPQINMKVEEFLNKGYAPKGDSVIKLSSVGLTPLAVYEALVSPERVLSRAVVINPNNQKLEGIVSLSDLLVIISNAPGELKLKTYLRENTAIEQLRRRLDERRRRGLIRKISLKARLDEAIRHLTGFATSVIVVDDSDRVAGLISQYDVIKYVSQSLGIK